MIETTSEQTPGIEGQSSGPAATPHHEADDAPRRASWLVVPAGLLAGLAAFLIGESTYRIIPAKSVPIPTSGTIIYAPDANTQAVADTRNAAIAFAALGGCLGLAFGLLGGLARRSAGAAGWAGLFGLLLGAAVPAGLAFATLPWFFRAEVIYPDSDMFLSLGIHALNWGLPVAAAGLALAVGLGPGDRRMLVILPAIAMLGAILGSLTFDLLGAAFFPFADTGEPISTTRGSRLLARLLVALGAALPTIVALPSTATRPVHPE